MASEERLEQGQRFLDFFESEALTLFREEEESLFREVLRHTDSTPETMIEALVDHLRIHSLVRALKEEILSENVHLETLTLVGETLERHTRMEERVLFPQIEKILSEENLANLNFADRRRTNT